MSELHCNFTFKEITILLFFLLIRYISYKYSNELIPFKFLCQFHSIVPYLVTVSCPTPMDCSPPGSSVYRDSPGKNTGVGYLVLFPGVFPTQELNPPLMSPALQQVL